MPKNSKERPTVIAPNPPRPHASPLALSGSSPSPNAATERNFNLRFPQKLRQLGDVRRDPTRLIFCE
jgi:hypothetical protein